MSIADPSSGNPKAFSDSFSSPTVGFSADILAHLKKLGARKELRGREDEKRKKLRCFVQAFTTQMMRESGKSQQWIEDAYFVFSRSFML